jgi:PAS domain S-box-containing protein
MPAEVRSDGLDAAVLDAVPDAIAILEPPRLVVWVNEAFRRTAGEDPTGGDPDLLAVLVPDSAALTKLSEAVDGAIFRGESLSLSSVPATFRGSPRRLFLDIDLRPVRIEPGRPRRALLRLREVTDEVRERELATLFRASFLSSSNAIEITDRSGVLVDVNPAFERTYGYSRAECIGRRPSLVRGKTTPPELYDRMWRDLLDPGRGYWSGELPNRDRMGKERPVFLTITAIRNEGGETTHYLGVAIDLTEQKAWARAAEHTDKLASIGQFAAGVAHEINTPLANVMLIAESIQRRSTDPWVRSRTETITRQVEVAGQIVRGLLDFARRAEPQLAEVDLVEVTRDALAFLKGKQSENVEFEERYPPEPVPVWGDRNQLIQVLTNLLNNACEAMAGQGKVEVEVRRADESAVIEILDNGPGIAPDALPHIFEPFYTTKLEGKGTGLGLAICHGIVQAHHGSISVGDHHSGGASFVITLPLTSHVASPGK